MQNGPVHNGHIRECLAETTAREKEALLLAERCRFLTRNNAMMHSLADK